MSARSNKTYFRQSVDTTDGHCVRERKISPHEDSEATGHHQFKEGCLLRKQEENTEKAPGCQDIESNKFD
jgi:hypothetical protein